ncbi:MAG: hypothetical protein KJ077_37115 [Anaerolineae bacterium]|nr:hypothetical protein [Anaerolineae bacterium]
MANPIQTRPGPEVWPELPLAAWQETYLTLQCWMQIVGKVHLALAPMSNHWWQVPFYLTARGLTTSPMFFGPHICQIDFDFIEHQLRIETNAGARRTIILRPRSVADFYQEVMAQLRSLGIDVAIWTVPVEVEERTPFEQDHHHAAYDPEYVQRFWRILSQVDRVLKLFRGRFLGKASPVHFFWGGFDLAATRFSGRRAPEHPGVPNVARFIMQTAYSHEVSSCGFWPGAGLGQPAFYAYAYPEPKGFKTYPVQPSAAYYSPELGEFLLPYDAVRTSPAPDETLLAFLQSTYEAAANLAHWDRAALEDQALLMSRSLR